MEHLHKHFGCSQLHVMVIYEQHGHVWLFMRSPQFMQHWVRFCENSKWGVCLAFLTGLRANVSTLSSWSGNCYSWALIQASVFTARMKVNWLCIDYSSFRFSSHVCCTLGYTPVCCVLLHASFCIRGLTRYMCLLARVSLFNSPHFIVNRVLYEAKA